MFTRLGCRGRPPQFVVEYHPYVGLTHTIRLREEIARVRMSDLLRGAPLPVVEAVAAILLGRMYRRRPPAELLAAYRRFSSSRATQRKLANLRRKRLARAAHAPSGAHHDLLPLFRQLNHRYFGDALPLASLSWSRRAWHSQLGCFDPALRQIILNRELDRADVPSYVIAYVLYHEMLHLKHPTRFARCRRQFHPARFRAEEKRFAGYARAIAFLREHGH